MDGANSSCRQHDGIARCLHWSRKENIFFIFVVTVCLFSLFSDKSCHVARLRCKAISKRSNFALEIDKCRFSICSNVNFVRMQIVCLILQNIFTLHICSLYNIFISDKRCFRGTYLILMVILTQTKKNLALSLQIYLKNCKR